MKMRELEERTGVDREVIRVLFRKGLLPEPKRPARNLAEYDETHVRAIAVVRQLQHDSRLTLDQIKDALHGGTITGRAAVATYQHLEELLAIRFGLNPALVPVASLVDRYPEADRDARTFARMKMVSIVETAEGPALSLTDAKLVEIWGEIRKAGFVESTGFPPENIAFYRRAAEDVAAMETKIFLEGARGEIPEESAAAMLQIALPLMLDFFGLLRMKAFMRNIHEAVTREAAGRTATDVAA